MSGNLEGRIGDQGDREIVCVPIVYVPSLALWTELSGHYSRDWSEYVNVIGVISDHSPVNLDSE